MDTEQKPAKRPATNREIHMMVATNAFPQVTGGTPARTAILFIGGILIATMVVMGAENWFPVQAGDAAVVIFSIVIYALFFVFLICRHQRRYHKKIRTLANGNLTVKETVLSEKQVKEFQKMKPCRLQYPQVINQHDGRCLLIRFDGDMMILPYEEDYQQAHRESYMPLVN